jgi:hypothetical protein
VEGPGVDGCIILKWILETLDWGGAWTESIWFRIVTGGRAVVNAVMNIWVLKNVGNFLTS